MSSIPHSSPWQATGYKTNQELLIAVLSEFWGFKSSARVVSRTRVPGRRGLTASSLQASIVSNEDKEFHLVREEGSLVSLLHESDDASSLLVSLHGNEGAADESQRRQLLPLVLTLATSVTPSQRLVIAQSVNSTDYAILNALSKLYGLPSVLVTGGSSSQHFCGANL